VLVFDRDGFCVLEDDIGFHAFWGFKRACDPTACLFAASTSLIVVRFYDVWMLHPQKVPWDIFLPGSDRYYGRASQYADLFAFVRSHGLLLDATTQPIPPRGSGGNPPARYNHTFTGGAPNHQLGRRWRLPFPFTAPGYVGMQIDGVRFVGQSLVVCKSLCDVDTLCLGVYFVDNLSGDGNTCYTLHELVECHTTLPGDSYTNLNRTAFPNKNKHRHAPPPPPPLPPPAASSEGHVRTQVRRSSNGSLAAVHIVDWRNALPSIWMTGVLPNTTFPPFTLNVSNAILTPPRACGEFIFLLHELGRQPNISAEVVVGSRCNGNVTELTLPSPVPWSLLEVRPG
jgi:hypothetical protein